MSDMRMSRKVLAVVVVLACVAFVADAFWNISRMASHPLAEDSSVTFFLIYAAPFMVAAVCACFLVGRPITLVFLLFTTLGCGWLMRAFLRAQIDLALWVLNSRAAGGH